MQVKSIHMSKVFTCQKYSQVKSICRSKVFTCQKYLPLKGIHRSKVFTGQNYSEVKSIHRSKVFTGQKYSHVKSIQKKPTSHLARILAPLFFLGQVGRWPNVLAALSRPDGTPLLFRLFLISGISQVNRATAKTYTCSVEKKYMTEKLFT